MGNLHPSVTEDLILALFSQIGPCKGCKIIHEVSRTQWDTQEVGDELVVKDDLVISRADIGLPLCLVPCVRPGITLSELLPPLKNFNSDIV